MARTTPLKLNYASTQRVIEGPVYRIHEELQTAFDLPSTMEYDALPPARTTLFKQVRSMLSNNRPAPATTTSPTSAIKWDEYSGEISENGKEAHVKPSTYKNPYEGILKSRKHSPVRTRHPQHQQHQQQSLKASGQQYDQDHHQDYREPQQQQQQQYLREHQHNQRSASPVSMLIDADLQMLEQEPGNMSPPNSRPVSPVSTEPFPTMHPEPVALALARPKTSGDITSRVKRKPVASSQSEQYPDPTEMRVLPSSSHGEPSQGDDPSSRFSWTTVAQSEAPRKSIDTRYSRQNRTVSEHDSQQYNSHFSWSTVASAVPGAMREQTPPPSPPPVPLQYLEPPTYGHMPTQSILSRQRPYKRLDKPEWAPSPSPVSEGYTPRSLTPKVHRVEEHPVNTIPSADGQKRLPLPPLFTEKSLSHLESLLTQEKNILLQRRNIERSIAELERVESASPLEVSFSDVREAKKKLADRRKVLDEVRLEEMDIGIRIARARRKEDFADGEGTFWVRRVTG